MEVSESALKQLETELNEDENIIESLIEEVESLDNLLSSRAQYVVQNLRPMTVTDNVYEEIEEQATLGEQIADQVAQVADSWRFIIAFGVFMSVWIISNMIILPEAFDPYPFILLNLGLSTLAALQAPVILMSQNRQSNKDRAMAQNDYQVNLKSELEIADLHRKIDTLTSTIDLQSKLINSLITLRQQDAKTLKQLIDAK